MLKKKFTLILSLLLITALSACNLPNGQGDATPTPDLALTLTALAAPGNENQGTPTLPANTATPEFTSTPEFTPTPSVPTVTVSVNTNCRTGPGVVYPLVGGLNVGQSAEVIGKSTSTNYWIIKLPGNGAVCWLWGEYATVSGNVANLQEYAIPPTPTPTITPTPAPPTAVSNLVAAKACVFLNPLFQFGGVITWKDNSDNETGFNIYLNGALQGTVGPNVTIFPIPPLPTPAGVPITMSVEAYNSGGKSAKVDVVIICP
jgi:hypothetical protein